MQGELERGIIGGTEVSSLKDSETITGMGGQTDLREILFLFET